MEKISLEKIARFVNGEVISGDPRTVVDSVGTDSRTVEKTGLFIPLRGENHDAHRFIPQVVERGCKAIMVSDPESVSGIEGITVVLVDDTLVAMQKFAEEYLKTLDLKKIGVTGSVGKTSTRDMVYYILSQKYMAGRPEKNYNNIVGLPLTVFSFDKELEAAVFEEGMDQKGQIHTLTEIARPEVAVITNIGVSHMENLGSRENIMRAKLEITDFFGEGNVLVVNSTDPFLVKAFNLDEGTASETLKLGGAADVKPLDEPSYRVVSAGIAPWSDYRTCDMQDYGARGIAFAIEHGGEKVDFRLKTPGIHNAVNATLACAACMEFGVSLREAAEGLANLEITGNRLRVKENNGITVIDDSYNAAPDSMMAAVDTLGRTEAGHRIAILGDMYELGEDEEELHARVGEHLAEVGIDRLITVGGLARKIAEGARRHRGSVTEDSMPEIICYDKVEDLLLEGRKIAEEGDTVLVKASNSLKLGRVADYLLDGENGRN